MTIVAWDGHYVVSDSGAFRGSLRCARGETKIKVVGDVVYAFTGTQLLFEPMLKWHAGGAQLDKVPKAEGDNSSMLIVFEKGRCFLFAIDLPYPDEMYAPTAWACGREFAIGAMAAGMDARRAVEIAIEHEVWLGGPIQVIDLQEIQTRREEIAA